MKRLSVLHHPRSRAARVALGGVVAVVVAVVFLAGCAKKTAAQMYHCPMHPDYVSDKPGDCPICGMRLVAMTGPAPKGQPAIATAKQRAEVAPRKDVYTCPMHPEVVSDKPGECPKCGMNLVKQKDTGPEPKTALPEGSGAAVPGQAAVHTDAERAELAGVRTVTATTDSVVTPIRAVGSVVPDETRIRHVTTKVGGWVEKLYVNAIGQSVRAGQPLLELYSPELLASQEEYVRAHQTAEEFSKSSLPEIRKGGEDLATSARRRLELFDVPSEFLKELDRTGKVQRTIVFRAPFSGYVSEKAVLEGHKVESGADLLTITDLSRVWVVAQLYEAEASAAAPGRTATITLPYDAATTMRGRVSLVYPTVDAESRTIKVRLEFPNPRLALKPGMFVNVALDAVRLTGIVVPDSAVIDSGTRQIVFVEAGPGHFEPREVQVTARSDGKAILRAGVQPGERVAAAANFLLDSESRLRGAVTSKNDSTGEHKHQ